MSTLFSIIVLLGLVGGLAFYRVKPVVWTAIIAVFLLGYTIFNMLSGMFLLLSWAIYLIAALTFNFPNIRRKLFMQKLFHSVKKKLPPMSQTEREALDAGDVWWDGDLFTGNPDWKKFHAIPNPTLTDTEQSFIDNQVKTLCSMLDDWKIVHEDKDMPKEVWQYIKQEGFLGLCIDKEYGGHGFSAFAHSCIITEISSRSLTAAVSVMVPNSLGPGELLHHYGTDAQKKYYLPRLAKGEEIPCFGLTAPSAGSDAAAIPDTGIICKGMHEGKEVLGINLNFDKRYITLAPIATVLGLAFKLYDPNHLLGDKKDLGITVALLPTDQAGVEAGARHIPMGMAFMNGPIRGKDVFIPIDWIIGGQEMVGQGWRMLMECLSIGRCISLPALATSVGKISYRTTGAYARIRKQFKTSIANFEGVQESLSKIAGYTYMLEACRKMSVNAVDLGVKPAVVSAIAKYNMTELSRSVMNEALDVHSGKAVQMGPSNYLAHGYWGLPISITVEGANILTRNLIIFGQGAMRCHPYAQQEIAAVNNPDADKGYKQFDKLICEHLGYTACNFARAFFFGITNAFFIPVDSKDPLSKYYKALTRMSTGFALAADMAMMTLGGELKRKERLSARLADILSQLYIASAVIKYFHSHERYEGELAYAEWSIQTCLYKIQIAFDELFKNFPNKIVRSMLSFAIFPLDRSYRHNPVDKLSAQLVKPMIKQSDLREELTRNCYIGTSEQDPIYLLELTLKQVELCEPIEQKIKAALIDKKLEKTADRNKQADLAVQAGIITSADQQALVELAKLVDKVIAVDEFQQLKGNATCKQPQEQVAHSE